MKKIICISFKMFAFVLVVCSQSLLYTNAYCASSILDSLHHNELSGQVFNPVQSFDYENRFYVTLGANKADGSSLPIEIKRTLRELMKNTADRYEDIELKQWVSCNTVDLPDDKQELRKFSKDSRLFIGNAIDKYEYAINGNIVGSIIGVIITKNSIDQKIIHGEYNFINGESHLVGLCVDNGGELVTFHTVKSLSEKGKLIKANVNMKERIFGNASNYDTQTGRFKTSKDGGSIFGNRIYLRSYVGDFTDNKVNHELIKIVFVPDVNKITFNGTVDKVSKCDNTEYTIDDKLIKITNVHPQKVHVDYYYNDYKYMEYDGLVRKSSDSDTIIETLKGDYKLANGDIIREFVCNENKEIQSRSIDISNSEFGKQVVKKAAENAAAEAAASAAEAKKRELTSKAEYERKKRADLLEEAENKKKYAQFRKNAKIGTSVRSPGGNLRGTITSTKGNNVEVQYTEELMQRTKVVGASRILDGSAFWQRINPVKEWVSRDELRYP